LFKINTRCNNMILEVQHETRLSYSEPVTEAVAEMRMEPVSDLDQSCHSFHLKVSPTAEMFNYQDGFGNRVHHFSLLPAHEEVLVLAANVVETHRHQRDPLSSRATFPLTPEQIDLEGHSYLEFGGPVTRTPLLTPVLNAVAPKAGQALAEWAMAVAGYIRS